MRLRSKSSIKSSTDGTSDRCKKLKSVSPLGCSKDEPKTDLHKVRVPYPIVRKVEFSDILLD